MLTGIMASLMSAFDHAPFWFDLGVRIGVLLLMGLALIAGMHLERPDVGIRINCAALAICLIMLAATFEH